MTTEQGLSQAILTILGVAEKSQRDTLTTLSDGSARILRLLPGGGVEEVERWQARTGTVSNVESLLDVVNNEARLGTLTSDGAGGRVTFTTKGAVFVPDLEDTRHVFTYTRAIAPEWTNFIGGIGTPMTHKEFLRFLKSLGACLVDRAAVLSAYRRVTLTRNSKLTSSPVLVEGAAGGGYEFAVTIDGAEDRIPQAFQVNVPYTRGAGRFYFVDVEVDVEEDEDEGDLRFTIQAPTIPAVADLAIMDEVAHFRSETEETLPNLLVVVNFNS